MPDELTFINPTEGTNTKKYLLIGLFAFLFVNSIILDIYFLLPSSKDKAGLSFNTGNIACPLNCMYQIRQATASGTVQLVTGKESSGSAVSVSQSPTTTTTPAATQTPTPTPTISPKVKEFYIPLGTGSGNAADWTTIPGIGATIDTGNYGDIDKAYLEVTVRIPTGNQTAYVRLHNSTNYQTVVGSEVSLSGGTTTILTSQPLTLIAGKNTYVLQLKTQLQYTTNIDQARIRIVTK